MLQFIISVALGWFIYEKFFRVQTKVGEDFLKDMNISKYPVTVKEFASVHASHNVQLPMIILEKSNMSFYSDPSDIIGVSEHGGVSFMTQDGEYVPIGSNSYVYYYKFVPHCCPICGREIEYEAPLHINTRGPVDTAIALDSEARYCKYCRETLNRQNTESYYGFYIDTVNKKLIKSSDKEEFGQYMNWVRGIKQTQAEAERVGYSELGWYYDEALRVSTLTEYTKNLDSAENWLRFRGLA